MHSQSLKINGYIFSEQEFEHATKTLVNEGWSQDHPLFERLHDYLDNKKFSDEKKAEYCCQLGQYLEKNYHQDAERGQIKELCFEKAGQLFKPYHSPHV